MTLRFLLCVALVMILSGCGEKIEPGQSAAAAKPVIKLPLLTLQTVAQGSSETFVGTIESLDRAVLVARTSGSVGQLRVREGDPVQPGQLLVEIIDDPLLDQLRVAAAAVVTAEKQLATSRARQLLAEQTAQRYQQLWESQSLTAQEYDQVKAELEVSRQQTAMLEAEVERALAGQTATQRQSRYGQVLSPFAGKVLSLQVKPGSTVLPGVPLLTIERSGQRQARISVPERLRDSLRVGTPMEVNLPALQQSYSAEVTRVQPGSDPGSRSFEALLLLPSTEELPTGMFVRATHQLVREEVLLIPQTAVTTRGQLTGVFLEREGVLHFRLVRLGRSFGDQLEVLSGLQAGDRIVRQNLERAVDGVRVES